MQFCCMNLKEKQMNKYKKTVVDAEGQTGGW